MTITRSALDLFRLPRLSRQQAFLAQGVTLRFTDCSWSGIREDDGSVIFAIRDADIETAFDGFRCLLWSPLGHVARTHPGDDRGSERLEHCVLARKAGAAEGLVVRGARSEVERNSVLAFLVRERHGEYWATWGHAPVAPEYFDPARPFMPRCPAQMAMAA